MLCADSPLAEVEYIVSSNEVFFFVTHYNVIGGFNECSAAVALLWRSFVEPKCDGSIENIGQPYG